MKRCFTLIELIVVIAIIAVLAAIVAVNAFRVMEKAKISQATADWKTFKNAVGAFYADTGQWPGVLYGNIRIEETGLLTNSGYPGWDGPYLESGLMKHPWGGIYWLSRNVNYKSSGWTLALSDPSDPADLDIEMGNECFVPLGSVVTSYACLVPVNSATTIDSKIDDGNLATGNVRYFCNGGTCGGNCGVDFRELLVSNTN